MIEDPTLDLPADLDLIGITARDIIMRSAADTPGRAQDQILTEDIEQAIPDHLEDDIYTKPNLNLLSTGSTAQLNSF